MFETTTKIFLYNLREAIRLVRMTKLSQCHTNLSQQLTALTTFVTTRQQKSCQKKAQ